LPDDIVDAGTLADNAVGLAQMAGGTDGNIITYDTSGNPAAVATGSSGQVLTSAGADAVPTFAAALNVQHVNTTRDMSTASGNVAITGVGFSPTAVVVTAMVESTTGFSVGSQTDTTRGASADYAAGGGTGIWTWGGNTYCINVVTGSGGSANQKAYVLSWDADGATFNWTKAGSPTGTAYIRLLFLG